MEVCPLSREVMLSARNLYPSYYRAAFAFSTFLYPHLLKHSLRAVVPLPGEIRGSHVPSHCQSGLGSSLSADSFSVHDRKVDTSGASYFTVLVRASQHLWPVNDLDVYQDFACADHTTQP